MRPIFKVHHIPKSGDCPECKRELKVIEVDREGIKFKELEKCPDHPETEPNAIHNIVDQDEATWLDWIVTPELDGETWKVAAIIEDCMGFPEVIDLEDFRFALEIEDEE